MSEVKANLEAAFELANNWRKESGQEILAAWLPAQPKKPQLCLLARAFNLSCSVDYESEELDQERKQNFLVGTPVTEKDGSVWRMIPGSGCISFEDESDARAFAEVTGYELDGTYSVLLPDEIALVAWEFDNGSFQEYAVEPEKLQ